MERGAQPALEGAHPASSHPERLRHLLLRQSLLVAQRHEAPLALGERLEEPAHRAGELGGRTIALRQRMSKAEAPEEWTEIRVDAVEYDLELPDRLFTLSNLRNPRD